jgi:FlaA1/EpsC-like NDP-sugar epimerase
MRPVVPASERLHSLLIRYRTVITVAGNLAIATAAYVVAFGLRFDFRIPSDHLRLVLITLPLLLLCKLVAFRLTNLFSGWWQHVSIRDVEDILKGNLLGSAFFLVALVYGRGLHNFPRSVFLLDLLLCVAAMAGTRLAIRIWREREQHPAARHIETVALIVGAGSAGIRLLDEIESRPRLRTAVAGFVDDDIAKVGLRISGSPVLGRIDHIPELVKVHDVNEVLVAIPSASPATFRRVVRLCDEARVRHRVLPTLGELVGGRVMFTQMREVKVDDLLAREPVRLDLARVRSFLAHRTILVTGAAGSIGSELCRQVAVQGPGRLVLYDRHENGMFALEKELQTRYPKVHLMPILGDILLEDQLDAVFSRLCPEVVFHAAAYKHVSMAERNPLEAMRNNVLGTRNVARAAIAHGTKEFVLVSTDKAVRPTSVMGVTKRVAEMVVQGFQNGCCRFVAVRFGNVLGSNGSVVPIFREQIARGGPVTVTHPDVTRYFMTIPEAVQLILQAAGTGHGGEIFVLEMGQAVRIADLARQMIRLSGFEPDEDIEIVFTGLAPGEKLHEELVSDGEEVVPTHHDRIRVLRLPERLSAPDGWLPALEACVEASHVANAVALLEQLVPAYRPSDAVLEAAGVSPGPRLALPAIRVA